MDAEKELKKAIKSGNSEKIKNAFEGFYNKNVRLVYRILIDSFGKDDETSDDVQESFVALLKDPLKLLSINRMTDYWIKTAKYIRYHRIEKQNTVEKEVEEIESGSSSIPKLVQGKEIFAKIEEWLGHPDSDIVILKVAYEYKEKEIAARLKISEDSVSYRYRKGIKELKRRLKDEEKQN